MRAFGQNVKIFLKNLFYFGKGRTFAVPFEGKYSGCGAVG